MGIGSGLIEGTEVVDEQWGQYGYNEQNVASAPENTALEESPKVVQRITGIVPVMRGENFVFVGQITGDGPPKVTRESVDDGVVWETEVEMSSETQAAIHEDAVYFVGDHVYKLDWETGEELWSADHSLSDPVGLYSVVNDDYVITVAEGGGGDYTINAFTHDGDPQWYYDGYEFGTPSIYSGSVYATELVGESPNHLISLDADSGEKNWEVDIGDDSMGPVTVDDQYVYVKTGSDVDDTVRLVSHDGSVETDIDAGAEIMGHIAADDSGLYVSTNEPELVKLTRDGSIEWEYVYFTETPTPPSIVRDVVVVGELYTTSLYGIDKTGEAPSEIWQKSLSGPIYAHPPASSSGVVFVAEEPAT